MSSDSLAESFEPEVHAFTGPLLMLKFKDREHLHCPPKRRPKSANDLILAERVGNSDDQGFHVMFAQSVPRIGIALSTGCISTSSGMDNRTTQPLSTLGGLWKSI